MGMLDMLMASTGLDISNLESAGNDLKAFLAAKAEEDKKQTRLLEEILQTLKGGEK